MTLPVNRQCYVCALRCAASVLTPRRPPWRIPRARGAVQAARPCLNDISIAVPRGGLTVVVGRVGAGKSSLLTALLGGGGGGGGGELPLLRGTCRTNVPRLSYAPQQPWVVAGTVRDNVLLGAEMDEQLYWQVRQMRPFVSDRQTCISRGSSGCTCGGVV